MTAFSHERAEGGGKDEWLTPPEITNALGSFDLDPCAPAEPPWEIALCRYFLPLDGLALPWYGRVWCNPPYGNEAPKWIKKAADHGNAIVLIFARTETVAWQDHIWPRADAVLFLRGRLHFHHVSGEREKANAVAGSALVAYGKRNTESLRNSGIAGKFIEL